jgi:anthranilate phosphoribosyltransferase
MSIAPYIKEIGRGKDGARSLTAEQSLDLFAQVLDGRITDLETGAFCLAMRIKGEEVPELDGFVRATLARCLPLEDALSDAPKGVVVLPSYNGARRLPNLTTLLALALARRGVRVLVHGPMTDRTRVTTAEVFKAGDWPIVHDVSELKAAWRDDLPAFMPIEALCPPLARLLDVRWTIGLRNPGHTVAKLLDPFVQDAAVGKGKEMAEFARPPSLRVVNHTHPEYAKSLSGYLQHVKANALLMRGTEGEPVADARRQPRFDLYLNGRLDTEGSRAPVEGVLTALPALPAAIDPISTVTYIREVLADTQPMPESIEEQVECLTQALAAAEANVHRPTDAAPSGSPTLAPHPGAGHDSPSD